VPFDLLKDREAVSYLMLLGRACLIWTYLSSHVSASALQVEECVCEFFNAVKGIVKIGYLITHPQTFVHLRNTN